MKKKINSLDDIDLSRSSEWFLSDYEESYDITSETTETENNEKVCKKPKTKKEIFNSLCLALAMPIILPIAILSAIFTIVTQEFYSLCYKTKLINERKNTLIIHSEIYNKEMIGNISNAVYLSAEKDLNKYLYKLPPGYFEEAKKYFKEGDLIVDNGYISIQDRIEMDLEYYDKFNTVLPLNIVNAKTGDFYSCYKHINMDKLMSIILFDVAKKRGFSDIKHIGSFDNEDETLKVQIFEIRDKHGFESKIEINHAFKLKGNKRIYLHSSFEFTTNGNCIYNAVARKLRCFEKNILQKKIVAEMKGSKITNRL